MQVILILTSTGEHLIGNLSYFSAHPNDLIVNLIELPDNKTPAKWSAYQIPSVIVLFVILVFKV
jgi:hypothetical protein